MKQQAFLKHISFSSPAFLLLVLSMAIAAIHITLTFKGSGSDRQMTTILFWLTTAYLLWEKQDKLKFQSGPVATLVGSLLLVLLLLKANSYCEESFLIGYPFFAGISLALIAAGFRGLREYWRELALLFFLGIPEILLTKLTDPAPFTAQFASSLLWYSGFAVTLKGIYIHLPGGGVEVYSGCSGTVAMTRLLGISILFTLPFPFPWKWYQKLILPIAAIAIGFVINAIRVALMAILISQKQITAFNYWHDGSGSLVFSVISALLLTLLLKILMTLFTPKLPSPES